MENNRRFSRETYVIGGVAIFIVVVGVIAAGVIMMTAEPEVLDENMWFRITSEDDEGTPLNSTLSLITLSSENGEFRENMLYIKDGEWQASSIKYEIGEVLRFAIFFYENGEYYTATYRIGRGPIAFTLGSYYIEFISYWELPGY